MSQLSVYTKFWRCAALVAPLIVLLAALAGCQTADSSLERIQTSGVLRVGLDPTYPPFELADEIGVTGLDVDLANELAAGLSAEGGIPVETTFTYFGYDGLYDALLTDQVDVLISALVISPERTRDFAYSTPYYDAGQVLVVPPDSAIATSADLAGQQVAVELGALGHVEALEIQHAQSGMEVMPFSSTDEALQAVVAGDADVAIVDSIGARLFLHAAESANPPLTIRPEPVSSELFAAVVRIENETLLEAINVGIAEMEADGRLETIIGRWLGP